MIDEDAAVGVQAISVVYCRRRQSSCANRSLIEAAPAKALVAADGISRAHSHSSAYRHTRSHRRTTSTKSANRPAPLRSAISFCGPREGDGLQAMPDQSVRASAPPTIHVSPASPRNASGSRPAPPAPRTDAADQDRSGTEAKRIVPADAGRGGVESSPRARSPVKAPPLQNRASHASTAGSASTAPRSDRSFLGSIASALPTFSLSSFRLPGAPTFETVEHDRESDVSERDVAARDEEDEASDSTESDLSSDEDEAVSEAPDFVVNRSTEPLPNLPHGGEGNEQVDLRNSPDLRIEDGQSGSV